MLLQHRRRQSGQQANPNTNLFATGDMTDGVERKPAASKLTTAQLKRKAKNDWFRRAVVPSHTVSVSQHVPDIPRKRWADVEDDKGFIDLFNWPTLPNTVPSGPVVAPP